MARTSKTTAATTVATVDNPARDAFVQEYLARREQPKKEGGIISRILNRIEDAATDTVAGSTRFAGRVTSAVSAAGEGFEEARRLEDVRQAGLAADRAARLGLL